MKPYYEHAGITIYHGDCREILPHVAADVMVTDPPYGIHHSKRGANEPSVVGEWRTGRSSLRVLGPEHVALRDAALSIWGERPALVFGHWRAPRPHNTQMRLIWDKGVIGLGGVGPWRPSDEELYVLCWPNPKGSGGSLGSVFRAAPLRGQDRPDHPTPKPPGLMTSLLSLCPPGIIVDPFMGSGATLVAAKNLGRRAIGIEIEERYCELAAKRLSQEVLFGVSP